MGGGNSLKNLVKSIEILEKSSDFTDTKVRQHKTSSQVIDFLLDQMFEKIKGSMAPKRDKADEIVRGSVLWSMGMGLIPFPVADIVAVTAVQIDMIKQISTVYEVEFSENQIKSWISALSGSILSRLAANALKFIPVYGSIIGGVSMAILSGASSYAMGQVFIRHFESGGTFLDFDVEDFKHFYEEQFEKGKSYAEDLAKEEKNQEQKEKKDTVPTDKRSAPHVDIEVEDVEFEPKKADNSQRKSSASDIFMRLKELSDLYDKGAITKEEFDKLKANLMKDM